MAERSGWDVLYIFLLTGFLLLIAHDNTDSSARASTSSASFRQSSSVIYVDDSSGIRWPVGSAVRDWSKRTDVELRYGACRRKYPCVRVTEGPLPRGNKTAARTTRFGAKSKTARTTGMRRGGARVRLSGKAKLPADGRRAVVCRELGYALGLSYHRSGATCMSTSPKASPTPGRADVAAVNRRY